MSGECPKCGEHALVCECLCDRHIIDDKWIRIEDKLPPLDEKVLFTFLGYDDDTVTIGDYVWYDPDYRWYDHVKQMYRKHVTAWMPLPAPPKDK